MKQVTSLRYIYKINSTRLRKNEWNIKLNNSNISDRELVKKRMLIGLADNQGFRFIKELANISIEDERVRFRDYLVSIVFDTVKDFDYACKNGVTINNKHFVRFVGTAGGIKKNTVLFINDSIYDEMNKRADNGRDLDKKLVMAKFEAYKSLMFSTSIPVSMPSGVVVVKDCIMKFKEDTIYITDTNENNEKLEYPTVEIIKDMDIELNITDGFGLCKPELMLRWTKEVLNDDNITIDTMFTGVCLRNAFLKGMCYPFDIIDWCNTYNNGETKIIDIWGNEKDLKECELILTEGMLKLWSSYNSIEDYECNCKENGYTYAVCKTSEQKIDKERTLNYQYLQSYEMSDKDIDNLISPTVKRIKDCICGDYKTTLKYLGVKENNKKCDMKSFTFKEALALCPELMNDEYIIKKVNTMIKKEIDETKIGKIRVKGNYQLASGDPFCLMQSACGLENVTGLLKKGEFYSSFWYERNANEIVIMRSPMTVHNNIAKGRINHSQEAKRWYKYMKNILIFNGHDNTMSAENGEDFDGDSNFVSNNKILLDRYNKKLTIVCSQSVPPKEKVSETKLAKSNKQGFSNNVGSVTNRGTSMYDIICTLNKNSKEYNIMNDRLNCCQFYQQSIIDSAKGIIATPMPKEWYIRNNKCETEDDKLNNILCVDKKPYFMIYIYKALKREYKSWEKQWEDECFFDFGCKVDDIVNKVNRTEEEQKFLNKRLNDMPVTKNNCIMNRICEKVEKEFNGFLQEKISSKDYFNYTILKKNGIDSNSEIENRLIEYIKVYNQEEYKKLSKNNFDRDEELEANTNAISLILAKEEILSFGDKDEVVNTFIDLAYEQNKGKNILWDIFSEEIIDNLLGGNC